MIKGELFKLGMNEAPVSTSTLSGASNYKNSARTSSNIAHSECEANRSCSSKIYSCPNDEIHNKSVAKPK